MTTNSRPRRAAWGKASLAVAGGLLLLAPFTGAGEAVSRLLGTPQGFEAFAPVSNDELAEMRGGLTLPNGMVLNFTLEFRTLQDGNLINSETFTDLSPELFGQTGIINKVSISQDGIAIADALPTKDINGLLNQVQNNASGVNLQHLTTLSADVTNAGMAISAMNERVSATRATSSAILSLGR